MRTLVIGGTHRRKLVSNILWCRTWSGFFFFRLRFDLFLIIFRFLCFVWPKISKMLNLYVIKLTAYLWKKNCCFWNEKKTQSFKKKNKKKVSKKRYQWRFWIHRYSCDVWACYFVFNVNLHAKYSIVHWEVTNPLCPARYTSYIYIGSSTLKRVKRKWHQFYQAGHFTFVL